VAPVSSVVFVRGLPLNGRNAEDLTIDDEALLLELLTVVRRVAAEVLAEHGACRVLTNLGRYQESKHLHFPVNSGEQSRPDGG
jgi:histidine triad (HIT) family protein